MKYFFYFLFKNIIDLTPFFLWKMVSLYFSKNKILKSLNFINYCNNTSKLIAIWLDFDNYIGDFFSTLNSIELFDKKDIKYYLIVNKKFNGIIEDLNLKNATLIYKSDFIKNDVLNLYNITKFLNENSELNISNIYCLNPLLFPDLILFSYIYGIKNIYKINSRNFVNMKTNSSFINRKSLKWSLFFLSNKNKFDINECSSLNKSSYDLFNELLDVNKINKNSSFDLNNKNKNIICSLGSSRKEKVLKENYIKEIEEKLNPIFVGTKSDLSFYKEWKPQKSELNFSIYELYEYVKNVDVVITYDTGLFHIAKFLNKEIILIVNKDFISYKYMKNYWFGNIDNRNIKIVELPKKYFN